MTQALVHRGPDDDGIWLDENCGIALGHCRLAILELTAAGHQPMLSTSGRYVLVFNGEIYNHEELRQRLPAQQWKGHSDTETLLTGIDQWGLGKALEASVGMFALALWDRAGRTLRLARDRMGEKPLYYGWQGDCFLFGSELKALKPHPMFRGEISRVALAEYVRSGYVPAPLSIYQGVYKLLPGTIATLTNDSLLSRQDPVISPYWSLEQAVGQRKRAPFLGSEQEAVNRLEDLLTQSIEGQQTADVPLGAFLSGGIDSSSVVALLQARASRPVRTFSIGFQEQDYDEAHHARNVATHLGTDHTEFLVTAADALKVIPELPTIYDEPFADASQIPTILVSRLARQHVTVAITGDGGDELFSGYGRYSQTAANWKRLSRLPYFARRLATRFLPACPLQEALGTASVDAFYRFVNRQWKGFPGLVLDCPHAETPPRIPAVLTSADERMMYADTLNYLPNDILVKVDRAAMSCSLESRVPLLDHRIVEFAWSLPNTIKHRQGVGKWPLKQLLCRYVPKELVERPKMGFGVPIDHWLRGPLREWAEDLLDDSRLSEEGFYDPKPIRKEWLRHLTGKHNRHYGLWTILMFQAWLNTNA
jgi:asparagine synthase (glutamine-hydrolysing)